MDELLREARRGRTTTRSTSAVCDRRARGRRNDAEAEPRPASVADQSAASVGGATVRPASGERHITDDVHCADAASKEHFFMCPALRKISSAARDNGGSSRRSSWSNTALWCSTSVATEGRSKHPHVCAPTNMQQVMAVRRETRSSCGPALCTIDDQERQLDASPGQRKWRYVQAQQGRHEAVATSAGGCSAWQRRQCH